MNTDHLGTIKAGYETLRQLIVDTLPASRERSIALTELESSSMFATKAVFTAAQSQLPLVFQIAKEFNLGQVDLVADADAPQVVIDFLEAMKSGKIRAVTVDEGGQG